MCVHEQQEIAVDDDLAAFVTFVERAAGKKYPETARETLVPLLIGHLRSVRIEPYDVPHAVASNRAVLEETAPPKHTMAQAQLDQLPSEAEQILILAVQLPVLPRQFIVLGI